MINAFDVDCKTHESRYVVYAAAAMMSLEGRVAYLAWNTTD